MKTNSAAGNGSPRWLLPLLCGVVSFFLGFMDPSAAEAMHPVHETVSEIEWNDETKRLEVALRLDQLDEQWLKNRLASQRPTEVWAIEYLREKFRIRDRVDARQPDTASYHWVGRETKGAHVWWFFEIAPADQREVEWIEQQMLFEREPNYVHRVLILGSPTKRSLNLHARRPKAYLNQSKDEPTATPVDR